MLATLRWAFGFIVILWTVLHLTNALHIPLGLIAG